MVKRELPKLRWDSQHDEFLDRRAPECASGQDLADAFNERFGTSISVTAVHQRFRNRGLLLGDTLGKALLRRAPAGAARSPSGSDPGVTRGTVLESRGFIEDVRGEVRRVLAEIQGAEVARGREPRTDPLPPPPSVDVDLSDLEVRDGERDLHRLVDFTRRERTLEDVCDYLELHPRAVRELVDEAKTRGYRVDLVGQSVGHRPASQDAEETRVVRLEGTGGKYAFGAVGDVHYGSKHHLADPFRDYCERAFDAGVSTMLCVGDLLDGVYHHSKWEQSAHGFEEQVGLAARELPRRRGVSWIVVPGNHDQTFEDESGIDVGRASEQAFRAAGRDDVTFLPARGAYVRLVTPDHPRGLYVHIWHPSGRAAAYAKCYDEKTEVLTDRGWTFFRDLRGDEKFATLGTNDAVEWQRASERQVYAYQGPMYRVRSRFVDLLVTPGHDVYAACAQGSNQKRFWKRTAIETCAEEWTRNGYGRWRMKRNARPQQGPHPLFFEVGEVEKRYRKPVKHLGRVPIIPYLRVLGYYVSEGCLAVGRSGHQDGRVDLSQSLAVNPETHADMVACIRALGLNPYVHDKGVSTSSRELAAAVLECGRGSHAKRVPQWVKELDAPLLAEFFYAYHRGDGAKTGGGSARNKLGAATTVSKQLADDLQEIALRLGFSATINHTTHGWYSVSFNIEKNEPRLDQPLTREHYSGFVYDVTVPNHVLYVRRNGKPCWSGNSYKLQKKIEGFAPGAKPDVLLMGHYHQTIYLPSRGVHGLGCGCWQGGGSAFGRSLVGAPDIGSWIVRYSLTSGGTVREFEPSWVGYQEQEAVRDVSLG